MLFRSLADQQCAQLCSEGKIVLLFGVVTLKRIVLNNATKSRLNLKLFLEASYEEENFSFISF